MQILLRTSAFAALLLAFTGLAFTPSGAPPEEVSDAAKATHTLSIEYLETRGDLRRSTLKIAPKERGARALWRGTLHSISVLTKDGRWIIIQDMEESRGSVQARATLPAPEDILAILLKPMRGTIMGWNIEQGSAFAGTKWTYLAQDGEETEEPAPEDPEPDDPEPEDPDDGPCSGIRDPWTGECSGEIRDPWPEDPSTSGDAIVIGI